MSANPKITAGLANRVAKLPRLCRGAQCIVVYEVNGKVENRIARYKDVAWDLFNGKPIVIGHTVWVGGEVVHVGIGKTAPLQAFCGQCGEDVL